MAEQPITVTVEGIAATLQTLTNAAYNLERYKSLYAAGPATAHSAGFSHSLDYSVNLFEANMTKLQAELRDLRDSIKAAGEAIIDADTEYGHLHSQLDAQLTTAYSVPVRSRNIV